MWTKTGKEKTIAMRIGVGGRTDCGYGKSRLNVDQGRVQSFDYMGKQSGGGLSWARGWRNPIKPPNLSRRSLAQSRERLSGPKDLQECRPVSAARWLKPKIFVGNTKRVVAGAEWPVRILD
jgi:hypothetical protein